MYSNFGGKESISLWCDGKKPDESDEEKTSKKKQKRDAQAQNKRSEGDDELEDIFQQLKRKHESKYSGPQLRLWARMIIAKTHDDMDNPPKVPMITGSVQRQPCSESLTDALTSAVAKAFSPTTPPSSQTMICSPSKTVDIKMKNLEQLRILQQLREDGILNEEEFKMQKQIIIKSLSQLV